MTIIAWREKTVPETMKDVESRCRNEESRRSTFTTRGWVVGSASNIAVRDIGYPWGSCNDARVHFHWRVILLPPGIIDYVMVHELAHVHVQNHGEDFWRRVEKVVPGFRDRKRCLAEIGADLDTSRQGLARRRF
jgi:hypothetical protein